MELSSEGLAKFFSTTFPLLDERQRRLVAAAMAAELGRGGQARVVEATGLARNTIIVGARELAGGAGPSERIRRPGAGRKKVVELEPELLIALDALIGPEAPGDEMPPLRWTAKSIRTLSAELRRLGHSAGPSVVRRLLLDLGYTPQATAGTARSSRPDRNDQFEYVNARASEHLATRQPVVSVDCRRHVSIDGRGEGWDDVGDDDDVPAFAVASIARWWERMGKARSSQATSLLVCVAADSGVLRNRSFQVGLAALAESIGLIVTVCHVPSGIARWNEIEQRLVATVSMSERVTPSVTYRTVVELVGPASAPRTASDPVPR